MKDLLAIVDETPITFAILILCVTLTVLMDPFHPDRAAVLGYGAVRAVEVADGQPWRLLTYTFVHNGGVVHLLFNMLGAMWLGPSLERSYGSLKFAVLWLVTGAIGGVAGCLTQHPLANLGGASGAVFGLMGAVVAANARASRAPLSLLEAAGPRSFLSIVGLTLLQGFLFPQVSNAAHIGGLVTGFLVTYWFLDLGHVERGFKLRRQQATVALLLVAAVFAVVDPVTRGDHLLLEWSHTAPGPRRDELRAAFFKSVHGVDYPTSDHQMTAEFVAFQQARNLDR
jgi:membrane associated rhomboid family serine protease